MRFNPCGKALDFGRRCYSVEVYPFKDSTLSVTWRWYPALREAGTYDGWSFLTSRDWLENHDEVLDLGEVALAPRPFYYGKTIPQALGTHVCGTADMFENGQVYDPDQDTPYNQAGLPFCCVEWLNDGVRTGDRPQADIRIGGVYQGRTRTGDSPRGVVRVGGAYRGRTRTGDSPRGVVRVGGAYQGRTRTGDAPYFVNWVEGGGVENPSGDYCDRQSNLQFGVWYLRGISTPNRYAWGWLMEPGEYCLAVRATFTSGAADPTAYYGETCEDRADHVLATTIVGVGPPWTQNGSIVDPFRDDFSEYWFRSFYFPTPQFLFVDISPDDISGTYLVKLSKGNPCSLPPPLEQIRGYSQG